MKYGVVYRVLVDYRIEADNYDEALEKAEALFKADERFDINDDYNELYCVDYYDDNWDWVETGYVW